MRVVVAGQSLDLTAADFVAQGGEASVYARGDTAYKVFSDPTRVPDAARLRALKTLVDPGIIAPVTPIFSETGARVGFTLPFLAGWAPLVRLFPPAYKQREGVDGSTLIALACQLAERVKIAHAAGALIVDLSEMNVLVSPDHKELALIDVDSWAIDRWPARAQADSIRDRHAPAHSQGTDWFAYAILMFQMFVGIHPYRGRHPTVKGLDARMHADLSVFHPQVVVPPMVDLRCIPSGWGAWFERVFDARFRGPPPALPGHIQPVRSGSFGLRSTLRYRHHEPLLGAIETGGELWTWSKEGLYCEGTRRGPCPPTDASVLCEAGGPIFLSLRNRTVLLHHRDGTHETTHLRATRLSGDAGRVFGRSGAQIVHYHRVRLGSEVVLTATPLTTAPPHCTTLYRGCALTRGLWGTWLHRFTPEGCVQHRLPSLDGELIVDALHRSGLTQVITVDGDKWRSHLFWKDQHRDARSETPEAALVRLKHVLLLLQPETIEVVAADAPFGAKRTVSATLATGLFTLEGQPASIEDNTVRVYTLEG